MIFVDVENPIARATFHHCLYELLNPSNAYRTTADLADAIRLHAHPQIPNAMVDGIQAPSVRTPPIRRYIPRQQVFFVPPNQMVIPATFVQRWWMTLEFADSAGQGVNANTRVIDWANPWLQLGANPAPVPAFLPRPNAHAFNPGQWYQFRVKYT
jgi:hypothetical protein